MFYNFKYDPNLAGFGTRNEKLNVRDYRVANKISRSSHFLHCDLLTDMTFLGINTHTYFTIQDHQTNKCLFELRIKKNHFSIRGVLD